MVNVVLPNSLFCIKTKSKKNQCSLSRDMAHQDSRGEYKGIPLIESMVVD